MLGLDEAEMVVSKVQDVAVNHRQRERNDPCLWLGSNCLVVG